MNATRHRVRRWVAGSASLLLLIAISAPSWAQTATPAALATPLADGSGERQSLMADPVARKYEKRQHFDAGIRVGTTAAGASELTYIARGTCVYDPASLATDVSEYVSCAAVGAAAGDVCFVSRRETGTSEHVAVISCTAFTDKIQFRVANLTANTINAGAGTYDYLVVR